jgi:uncharacterized protein
MKRALIFYGGWDGHQPEACANLLATQLRQRGFLVDAEPSLDALNDPARLGTYDVIVPIWTMGSITAEQERNLSAAVLGGTGIAGFHGGMGDAFRGSIEYQWMVGGQFVSHPDNFKAYRVDIVQPQDPIVSGIDSFEVYTEQYYMLVDPAVEVLAQTRFGASAAAPWVEGVVMPVVWKKRHGKGRVFYCALGHSAQEFSDRPQQLEITLRGISWAAGR